MLTFIAHDTVNDIALIKTSFYLCVRYGLDQKQFPHTDLKEALDEFNNCQAHALVCQGEDLGGKSYV